METALTAYPTLPEVIDPHTVYTFLLCVFHLLGFKRIMLSHSSRFDSEVLTPVTVLAPLKR